MRFPSIRQAGGQAKAAAQRFPVVLLAAFVAAVAAQVLVDFRGDDWKPIRVMFTGMLGIPLFIAIQTAAERSRWPAARKWGAVGVAALVLAAWWWFSAGWSDILVTTRFFHLLLAFHLMVAVLPFVSTRLHHAFWQYNRLLFQRFLMATLFTLVLFAGLAIALLAIDNLFGVDIDPDVYIRLFLLLAFVFHPWFFLGGVPADLDTLEERTDYPGGLKVFAQFILIPVVTVYLAILTAYLVRVLVTRTWPSGWIGWLVSSVSAAGTLALLLVHPVRERADSKWVNAYGRWFYVVLLPSIAMLMMAIWQRMEQYGLTERRYFLAILAVWLAAVALYYAITASRNIRILPASLCLLALLTYFGPWGAYAVSRNSQAGRLRAILVRNEMLADGRVQAPPPEVAYEDRREIAATVRYLVETHGEASLGRVSAELRQAAEEQPPPDPAVSMDDPVTRTVMARLGVEYVSRYETFRADPFVHFFANTDTHVVDVRGYDAIVRTSIMRQFSVPIDADTLEFAWQDSTASVVVSLRQQEVARIAFPGLVDEVRERMVAASRQPRPAEAPLNQQPIQIDAEGGGYRFRFLFLSVTANDSPENRRLNAADADILVGRN